MIYNILAHYYDALVKDDTSTQKWIDWIEEAKPGNEFLELACGSGEITLKLAQHHQVSAMDLSEQMVEEARRKEGSEAIDFRQGDMKDLSDWGMYDAIGCFCDSFNYLLSEEDVRAFFKEVSAHLRPNGLFLFDTHSMDRLEEFEQEYEEAGQFEDGTQVQWLISSEDSFIFQDFAFYIQDQTIQEHHLQRVYEPVDLAGWLQEANLEILSVKTDFDLDGIQDGEKYFFVCRKQEENA